MLAILKANGMRWSTASRSSRTPTRVNTIAIETASDSATEIRKFRSKAKGVRSRSGTD